MLCPEITMLVCGLSQANPLYTAYRAVMAFGHLLLHIKVPVTLEEHQDPL